MEVLFHYDLKSQCFPYVPSGTLGFRPPPPDYDALEMNPILLDFSGVPGTGRGALCRAFGAALAAVGGVRVHGRLSALRLRA